MLLFITIISLRCLESGWSNHFSALRKSVSKEFFKSGFPLTRDVVGLPGEPSETGIMGPPGASGFKGEKGKLDVYVMLAGRVLSAVVTTLLTLSILSI